MPIRSKTALLKGNFAEGNFGDDALAMCNFHLLRYAFDKVAFEGEVAYSRARDVIVGGYDLRPSMIVYGGGTQFFSMPLTELEAPQGPGARLARALVNPARLIESARTRAKIFLQRGVPVIALGLGLGPFDNDGVEEASVVGLVKTFNFLWVRDQKSFEFCDKHGLSAHFLSSDLCFIEPFRRGITSKPPTEGKPRKLGIVLQDHPRLDRAFMEKIAALAKLSRQAGREVEFLSFSRKWDIGCAAALSGESFRQWDPESETIEEFAGHLGACDLIVTTRFHGGIFALLTGRPFVAIELEQKHRGLREVYDPHVPCFIDVDESLDRYADIVESCFENHDVLVRCALSAREVQAKSADRGMDRLACILHGDRRAFQADAADALDRKGMQ